MFHLKRSLCSGLFLCSLVSIVCLDNANAQAVAEKAQVKQSGNSLSRVTHDIEYLASDELAGRKPGTPDAKGSASLVLTSPEGKEVSLEEGKQYSLMLGRGEFDVKSDLVFVGYGISAADELKRNLFPFRAGQHKRS